MMGLLRRAKAVASTRPFGAVIRHFPIVWCAHAEKGRRIIDDMSSCQLVGTCGTIMGAAAGALGFYLFSPLPVFVFANAG
jgi:hypothetical protein